MLPRSKDHSIEGIGEKTEKPLLWRVEVDEVVRIDSEKAVQASRKLARKEGLMVGISSGANVAAAEEYDGEVLTVLPDNAERYFTTELFNFGGDS